MKWLLVNLDWAICLMSSVFANGPADQGSIPGWDHTKEPTLDATLAKYSAL